MEPFLQLLTITAAHLPLAPPFIETSYSPFESIPISRTRATLTFTIDDRRIGDPPKRLRIEFTLKIAHAAAQQLRSGAD